MQLDIPTIVFVILLNSISISFLFIILFFLNRKKHWHLALFVIGIISEMAGVGGLAFQEIKEDFTFTFLGNALMLWGFAIMIICFIYFKGKNKKEATIIFLSAFILFLIIYSFYNSFTFLQRVVIFSVWTYFYFSYGGIYLIRHRESSVFASSIGILFFTFAVVMLARAVLAFFFSSTYFQYQIEIYTFVFYIGNLLIILGTFGFALISKEADEKTIEQDNLILKQANESKIKLFSIISHDLKGPAGFIKPIVELLEDKYENESVVDKKLINAIKESSDKLTNLIDSVLAWSRYQFKHFKVNLEFFNTEPIIAEIIELYRCVAEKKNIKIHSNLQKNTSIYFDKEIFRTSIRNLLSNALKFSFEGNDVAISLKRKNEKVFVFVKDTGVGIGQEKLNKIFSLNQDQSTKGTSGEIGTGLGLTLISDLIKKAGGDIKAESENKKGTTFILILPR